MDKKKKAILLMLFSTLSFSIMQLLVKLSGHRFPALEQIFFRNLFTLFIGLFMVLKVKGKIFGKAENRGALFARAFFGLIGVAGYFYATRNMNIADASLLHRSSPFFVILFSSIFLKNRLGKTKLFCLLLACAGAFIIIRPNLRMEAFPAFVALLSAAGAGAAYIVISYLKGKEENGTIIFCFSLVSVLFSLVFGGKNFVLPDLTGWIFLFGIGGFAALGQILLTRAYKMTEPGGISIINYSGILFSAVLGICFLREVPSVGTIIGGILILSAAFILFRAKM